MHYGGWLIAVVVVAGVCWAFPLFRVVPLERALKAKSSADFNADDFAEKLWNGQLLKSLDKVANTDELLSAIQADAAAAKKKFARSVGVSESYTYFVSGKGRVLAASDGEIALAVSAGATNAEVSLQVGLLFGNAVRDGTDLLNVNNFPNSQDFNSTSEALNRIIETRVLPKLREQAKVGATIQFVGVAEVNDEATDLKPLKVIPIRAEMQ